ncbi:MAG: family 20 glycosylhydrolase [Chthoniobacterales bacterium]|nr:family 20 glycosylhydrolase [Chthoniobacterales bacterium]
MQKPHRRGHRPLRAFHLDLKGLPPTPKRLNELVSLGKAAGFNAVLVEWEDQFPWKEKRYRSETAYTKSEVAGFHAHCAALGMQVIPLVQCLGHMETWLRLPEHERLREVPRFVDVLHPLARGAGELVAGLVKEVLALTPGPGYFHLGGDEAWTFGQHPDAKAYLQKHSKGELYLKHVEPILDLLIARGIRPILWHDMMVEWDDKALRAIAEKADLCIWGYSRYCRVEEPWLGPLGKEDAASKLPVLSGGGKPISEALCARFQRAGVRMWGAGAYKCGSLSLFFNDLPDPARRLTNALDWGAYAGRFPFVGLVATAWSRNTTDAPQYMPIDAALDVFVATGIIWKKGLGTPGRTAPADSMLRLARHRALALLKKLGQEEVFSTGRELMAQLTKARHAAWVEAVRLRETLACMTGDPRRKSLVIPEKQLGYVLEHVERAEKEMGPRIVAHFQDLVPRIWIKRYLAERIEPLRQEYHDLQHRMAKMF